MKPLYLMNEACLFHNAEMHVWPVGKRMRRHENIPGTRLLFYHTLRGQALLRRKRDQRRVESRVGPGMAFLAFSDGPLDWRAVGKADWRFNFVNIALRNQEPVAREFAERFGDVFRLPNDSPLARLLSEYVAIAHNQKRTLSVYEASEMGYRFLMSLFENLSHSEENELDESIPLLVRQVEQFMQGRLNEKLGVEELRERAGVSAPTLNKMFMLARGMTAMQRLVNYRVERARVLLRSTDYPLKHIAALCGFSSLQYFCGVFQKHEGAPPGVYRKRHFL